MNKLGVIGGLGPIATAYFLELIIKMTNASWDQDHIDMIIYNYPSIPDRTKYIIGESNDSPIEPIINIGKRLCAEGMDYIAMPCITAHYFYEEISNNLDIPIINIISETVEYLKKMGITKVGIMATDGTMQTKMFQKELNDNNMISIIPDDECQKHIMSIIYDNVKANIDVDMDRFNRVSKMLKDNGAEVIILGCTELSLIKRDKNIGAGYIDAMEVLAMRSIELCKASLNEDYKYLITR